MWLELEIVVAGLPPLTRETKQTLHNLGENRNGGGRNKQKTILS